MKKKEIILTLLLTLVLSLTMTPKPIVASFKDTNAVVRLTAESDEHGQITEWMLKGDPNRDGKISSEDVTLLERIIIEDGTPKLTGLALESGDVRENGIINTVDSMEIEKLLASPKLPQTRFKYRVIDSPNEKFMVSKIELIQNHITFTLEIPDKNTSTTTVLPIAGAVTVTMDEKGSVTVVGNVMEDENRLKFYHESIPDEEAIISLKYHVDEHGEITKALLKGDADGDDKVTTMDRFFIKNTIKMLDPMVTDPDLISNIDFNQDNIIDAFDYDCITSLVFNTQKLPSSMFTYQVVNKPKKGYQVKDVTIIGDGNSFALTLENPMKGGYKLALNADGTTTVTGKSLYENTVYFRHHNKAPVIIAEDKILRVNDYFNPLDGIIVKDEEDGNILLTEANIKLNTTNMKKAGTYHITYQVSDSGGNISTKTITITVNPNMIEINAVPKITADDKTLEIGDQFHPLNDVVAVDKEDGIIVLTEANVLNNNVDTNKVGSYYVTYVVYDSNDNKATKTIKVTVKAKYKKDIIQTGDTTSTGIFVITLIVSFGLLIVLRQKRKAKED